ncbi:M48 family metallopeptidase [Streptomyces sp. NPDC016566]|uniref:M48 family metallopeptidase n=1 Tax=unclassified Streptomyces TaxID=2593676 RepID=UPI0011A625C2|nr:M48 family metallopeptidase [Streptomyces sp. BK340]TVZ93529.1 Zn-dependent protease with chaperone function [Streptomyces sp. BK340]
MGATLRALRALVLLSGFYLLSLLLLAVLVGADVAAFGWGLRGPAAFKLLLVTAVLAVPVVRGMFMLRTPRGEEPAGIPVTEADEPRLWALVRDLAAATGTRAPDRILLTADVNAAVSEESRFLGLLPGPRRLFLGVPLLTGLTEAQLRGVLAHEYGHFTGGDTRLSALVVRGRVQIARVIGQFHAKADGKVAAERARQEQASAKRVAKGRKAKRIDTAGAGATYRTMAKIYTAYGKLYLRASLSTARAQEYAADLAAARIAGRDATASALREIPVLAESHEFYLDSYATLGLPARLLPPHGEFFGGFGRLLTAREEELAELRAELAAAPVSPYDSHPPIAERVRRIEELPSDGRTEEATDAALALLTDPQRTLAALEDTALTDEVLAFRRTAEWPELLNASMAENLSSARTPLHEALTDYTGQPATLSALLDVIDDGRLWRLAERLPLSEEAAAAKGRAFREFVRPRLQWMLRTMVLAEFSARSLLQWEFSWSREAVVRLPGWVSENTPDDDPKAALEAAVEAALADHPDTAPLRALLPPTAAQPA